MSLFLLNGLVFIEWDIYSLVTQDLQLNTRKMDKLIFFLPDLGTCGPA